MATATKTKSNTTSKASSSDKVEHSKLMKLFEDEMKDIYWAEKALTKALPKMAKNASAPQLVKAIQKHLKETESQVKNVEKVFKLIGKKPVAKKCEAMAGLLKEGTEIMQDSDKGGMRDAGIILASQKVEHYEIATYGTLKTFAKLLGLSEVATILETILDQEKNADASLSEIAESAINVQALNEMEK